MQALSTEERSRLRDDILARSREVARAGRGFLGFGFGVSQSARQLLDGLDRTLRATGV